MTNLEREGMTQAFDAAVRVAAEAIEDCEWDAKYVARAILRAALPEKPPEWFGAWWDNGWELSDETEVLGAWLSLRAHLLGENA